MYSQFCGAVEAAIHVNDIATFKSDYHITGIFEHVNYEFGQQYLSLVRSQSAIPEDVIVSFCQLNDQIGGGQKYTYGTLTTSPSNFRYLYHAHLILSHIRSLHQTEDEVVQPLVELGCGYGGLCIAVCMMSSYYRITISEYRMIDLPIVSKLQQRYHEKLSEWKPDTRLFYHSALDYGSDIPEDKGLFLISNYCFSEISEENQKKYREQLLIPSKVTHGFMTWNMIPIYSFGYEMTYKEEVPLTYSGNLYVYF